MGRELACRVRVGRRRSEGTALLESAEIVFRGEPRLRIPFKEIGALDVRDGELIIEHGGSTVAFQLGAEAARWADRIRNPKGRLDKLGVKPDSRVAVLGIDDAEFAREVDERTDDVSRSRPRVDTDLIFLGVAKRSQLARLGRLREAIKPAGGIWVVWPKGRAQLREEDIRAAAKQAGLVDVKVVAFSATHSALKLVIPVSRRR